MCILDNKTIRRFQEISNLPDLLKLDTPYPYIESGLATTLKTHLDFQIKSEPYTGIISG